MPGTLTVKPIRATFTHNKDFLFNKMDPYCEILLGGQKVTTHVCAHGGKTPSWGEVFTLRSNNEPVLYVNIKDKDRFSHDDNIGMVQVDLKNVSSLSSGPQWYPVTGKHGSEGELLLDISFNGGTQMYNQQTPMYGGIQQTGFPGQIQNTMPMTQPTVGYPTTQPMTVGQPTMAYQQPQPTMAYQQPQPTMAYQQPQPTMAYQQPQPTVGYQQVQPTVGCQQVQPTMGYPHGQPMMNQMPVQPTMTQPTVAYTQPVGTVMPGVQQAYPPTNMGYGYR